MIGQFFYLIIEVFLCVIQICKSYIPQNGGVGGRFMSAVNPFSVDNGSWESLLVSHSKNNVATEIEGDVVLLDLASGAYVGLNAIGSSIWSLIEKPISMHNLFKGLMEEYDVAEEMCRADTVSFLEDLFEKKLLIISEVALEE